MLGNKEVLGQNLGLGWAKKTQDIFMKKEDEKKEDSRWVGRNKGVGLNILVVSNLPGTSTS